MAIASMMPVMKPCPTCGTSTDAQWFCRNCGEFLRAPGTERMAANLWRRFGALLLDDLLFIVLLVIGWLVWFGFFTAKNGQTPGKQLLGLRVMRLDGTIPTAGTMWLREVVIKGILWGAIAGALSLIAYIWAFFDKDRQTVHDKMVGTYVVYHPGSVETMAEVPITPEEQYAAPGVAPATARSAVEDVDEALRRLTKMRDDGLITNEEFDAKRQDLIKRM